MTESILFWVLILLLIATIVACTLLSLLNGRKSFTPLPVSKPSITVNAKYRFSIRLSDSILNEDNPLTPITRSLDSFDFVVADSSLDSITFERPFKLRDVFSPDIKKHRVRLRLSLPVQKETDAFIDVIGGAIGFNGGLWQYVFLLREHLEGGGTKCKYCGYNLRGIASERCPECGVTICTVFIHPSIRHV